MATDTVPIVTEQIPVAEDDVTLEKTARYEVLAQLNEDHCHLSEVRP